MLVIGAQAQTEPEYRLEIGGGIGLASYEGDFNGNIIKNPQASFSLLARYKYNPRVAVAMNITYLKLEGSAKDVTTFVPAQWQDYSFKRKTGDVGVCEKYNVKAIMAHNMRFDYNATQTTQRYLTKSKYRWFLPYGIELWVCLVVVTISKMLRNCL